MIPRGADGIRHLATRLATDIVPCASDGYMAADLSLMAALVTIVAQDYDRAADVLTSDYDDICEIFREALLHLDDPALESRMVSVRGMNAQSLRVHEQSARTDAALRVLIELHAAIEDIEERGVPWAARLNGKIWDYLTRYVARRTYQMDA